MRISTKGRYSLEALLCMALLPPGEYASTRAIAAATGISDGYLEQLFIPLRRAGMLKGVRGPQGGYTLSRDAADITVGAVLRAVEGPLNPAVCADPCPEEARCRSRYTWTELYREINGCVDSITMADLTEAYAALDQIEYTI
ncbi:MAG: Rrf2 family transcriptional regulator [Spirochaetaceae bacterium]|nr:Rrf2 family transcriptional regulator [Spirochaetaceae bacterium]